MNRSLDFTACDLPCEHPCWRRLTEEEWEWLETHPNRQAFTLRKKKMSHNPNTIKSQDELNEGGRKSDVLLSTIEELERTKKQLGRCRYAIRSALNLLSCPDRISETECNEQLAFNELMECLKEIDK